MYSPLLPPVVLLRFASSPWADFRPFASDFFCITLFRSVPYLFIYLLFSWEWLNWVDCFVQAHKIWLLLWVCHACFLSCINLVAFIVSDGSWSFAWFIAMWVWIYGSLVMLYPLLVSWFFYLWSRWSTHRNSSILEHFYYPFFHFHSKYQKVSFNVSIWLSCHVF